MSKLGANTNFSDFNVYTHRLTHRVLTKAISFYVKRGTLIFLPCNLHLMRTIARAQASTLGNSLMRVKTARAISAYDTYCLGHWNKKTKRS